MAAEYVAACDLEDFDTSTGTCSVMYYVPNTSGFPALTIEQANQIGAQIALLWAIAWIFRRIGKAIQTIG